MSQIRFGLYFTDLTILASGASYKVANEEVVVVDKTVGSATAISLPTPGDGRVVVVKDGKGDAATNNITVSDPAGNTIDGAASLVISTNYGHAWLVWNGKQWNQIG